MTDRLLALARAAHAAGLLAERAPEGSLWTLFATQDGDQVVCCKDWLSMCRRYRKLQGEDPTGCVIVVLYAGETHLCLVPLTALADSESNRMPEDSSVAAIHSIR